MIQTVMDTNILVAALKNQKGYPARLLEAWLHDEFENLKYHFGTPSQWGGRRKLPFAFTEHGAIMLAGVLNTQRAIEVSTYIVRAFVKYRELLASDEQLAKRVAALERKAVRHGKQLKTIVIALGELMTPKQPAIGFLVDRSEKK